jgi:hypothetical protein
MRIGLDFDNTIIRYDEVFRAAARQRNLLPPDFAGTKQEVREAIRLLPDGELKWQALQGHVYGKGIGGAELFRGLSGFLRRVKARGDTVLIVSHKTRFGHFDQDRVDLREAALNWMSERDFFAAAGFGIRRQDVHFLSTRDEKLARIGELGCDVFVDDLQEVLDDPAFPSQVRRILLSDRAGAEALPYAVCRDWASIEEALFVGA